MRKAIITFGFIQNKLNIVSSSIISRQKVIIKGRMKKEKCGMKFSANTQGEMAKWRNGERNYWAFRWTNCSFN